MVAYESPFIIYHSAPCYLNKVVGIHLSETGASITRITWYHYKIKQVAIQYDSEALCSCYNHHILDITSVLRLADCRANEHKENIVVTGKWFTAGYHM